MLYPRRCDTAENRLRWSFGTVLPAACVDKGRVGERSAVHTECLLESTREVSLEVEVRFLRPGSPTYQQAGSAGWQDGVENRAAIAHIALDTLLARPCVRAIEREGLEAVATVTAVRADEHLTRIAVTVRNATQLASDTPRLRETAALHALLSCHIVLRVHGDARWISIAVPPRRAASAALTCRNEGLWPALVSDDDSVVLASPIILEDHPHFSSVPRPN